VNNVCTSDATDALRIFPADVTYQTWHNPAN
jgi:hypothetical protein